MASILIALALSFFVAGLGIVYQGNLTLGVGLVLLWLMLCLVALYSVGLVSMFAGALALIVWTYGFLETLFISLLN